jgi:hypothetical protein
LSVNMLLALPGAGIAIGEKLAVTPLGSPATDNARAEANPLAITVPSVILDAASGDTAALATFAAKVKLGTTTVRFRAKVLVTPPPVAVTVRW